MPLNLEKHYKKSYFKRRALYFNCQKALDMASFNDHVYGFVDNKNIFFVVTDLFK
jgi:hypothetical protein